MPRAVTASIKSEKKLLSSGCRRNGRRSSVSSPAGILFCFQLQPAQEHLLPAHRLNRPAIPTNSHPSRRRPPWTHPPAKPSTEIQLRQHQTTRPNFVERRGNHADKITSEAEKVTSPLALNSRFCRPPKPEEGQLREGNQACFYIHRRQQLCRRSWPCNSNASFHRSSISRCGSLVELRWTFLFVFKTPEHVRNDRLPLLLIHCDSQYPR